MTLVSSWTTSLSIDAPACELLCQYFDWVLGDQKRRFKDDEAQAKRLVDKLPADIVQGILSQRCQRRILVHRLNDASLYHRFMKQEASVRAMAAEFGLPEYSIAQKVFKVHASNQSMSRTDIDECKKQPYMISHPRLREQVGCSCLMLNNLTQPAGRACHPRRCTIRSI